MTAPTVGTCARCGHPVHRGDDRRETVHQNTGPGREILTHRTWCRPKHVRTWT
jgi:hypothetical protein